MRTRWVGPALAVLAAGALATPASAQTIAYTNFLRFDLQSFRSQATAGMFDDDIEMVSDASRLMNVEGNRLFTSFSNLADPAGLGDNILSYSVDHNGVPGGSDPFDSGSYLLGWIGKVNKDSRYNFSLFYQRNSTKAMFEDLEDGNIGVGTTGSLDAEYTGSIIRTSFAGTVPDSVLGDTTLNYDLTRYDERSATDFDFGAARDVSEALSIGGRLFFEKDQVNSFADGITETVIRADADSAAGTQLDVVSRGTITWQGNGEEAFRYREMGISLDADYHPWDDQSVGLRVDVFGSSLTNPGTFSSTPSTFVQPTGPYYDGWTRVNLQTNTTYTRVYGAAHGGGITAGLAPLESDRFNRVWATAAFPYPGYVGPSPAGVPPVESVDDTRDGIGINAKGEYNREWGGGEINSWFGFGHRGLDISATVTAVDRSGSSFWWNDGTGDYEAVLTTRDQTLTMKRSGDMTLDILELGGRWNRDLNANVSVGLGAVLTRDRSTEDYRHTNEDVVITDAFSDGNDGANVLFGVTGLAAYDERATTATTIDAWNVKDEIKVTYLRLPVGTQFHFLKRWTFNMGAQHVLVNTKRETRVGIPADGNGMTTTTQTSESAGTTTTTYPTSAEMQATTVIDRTRSNHTTYWYGLSVDITDAVQLDINGFLDSDSPDGGLDRGLPNPSFSGGGSFGNVEFWRNLAISMKYMFW